MPLDPQAQAVIDTVNALGLPRRVGGYAGAGAHQRRIPSAPRRARSCRRGEPQHSRPGRSTFPSASTRRKAMAPSPSWSGITVAVGWLAIWIPPTRRRGTCARARAAWWCPLTTGWPRRPSSPARPRTATPPRCGPPTTPPASMPTPRVWPWAATAPGATWPPPSR